MADSTKKINAALKEIETARRALEKEQRRLERAGASKTEQRKLAKLFDKLDETQFTLLNAREESARIAREEKAYRYRPLSEIDESEVYAPKKGERVAIERELNIRGFWDRYPSEQQRGKYKSKFKHVPKELRRGKTAYDQLQADYLSFSPAERKRLVLRVSYGVVHETGEIITPDVVRSMKLDVRLSSNRQEALNALSTLLVRAGVIYAAEGYEDDDETTVPLGVEWVVLPKQKSGR